MAKHSQESTLHTNADLSIDKYLLYVLQRKRSNSASSVSIGIKTVTLHHMSDAK